MYQLLGKTKAGIADRTEAGQWLRKSAEAGNPQALYEIGNYSLAGRNQFNIAKNPQQARKWLEQAVDLGNGNAIRELARRYQRGAEGWPLDLNKAAEYYRLLADGYSKGRYDMPVNQRMAAGAKQKADEIEMLQQRLQECDMV